MELYANCEGYVYRIINDKDEDKDGYIDYTITNVYDAYKEIMIEFFDMHKKGVLYAMKNTNMKVFNILNKSIATGNIEILETVNAWCNGELIEKLKKRKEHYMMMCKNVKNDLEGNGDEYFRCECGSRIKRKTFSEHIKKDSHRSYVENNFKMPETRKLNDNLRKYVVYKYGLGKEIDEPELDEEYKKKTSKIDCKKEQELKLVK